jgi:hypothetical protein
LLANGLGVSQSSALLWTFLGKLLPLRHKDKLTMKKYIAGNRGSRKTFSSWVTLR